MTKETNNRVGLAGLLGIIFVVMKLMHWGDVANWSWWWVLSPFWIPFAIGIIILIGTFIYDGIVRIGFEIKNYNNPNSLTFKNGKPMLNRIAHPKRFKK